MNDALARLRTADEPDLGEVIRLAAEAIVSAIEELRLEVQELRKDVAGA